MNIRRRLWNHPLAERFAVGYYADPSSGCWLWEGTIRNGYGTMKVDKVTHYAHRLSWVLSNGEIPEGMEICHRCDITCCVNPAHLFVGTHEDNMTDARVKGRLKDPPPQIGIKHHAAKLTEDEVRNIRTRRANGESMPFIAKTYGMTKENIRHIVSRKTWRHVA